MKIIDKILEKFLLRDKDKMSFKTAMDLCNLPVVTFYQGNKRFNFLLDTGSNSCIINKSVLNSIDHAMIEADNDLFGMEGKPQKVDSCRIILYFNDRGYTFDYLIQDLSSAFGLIKKESGVTLHGIIGSSFFNKFKYVLDFAELIAYSKK